MESRLRAWVRRLGSRQQDGGVVVPSPCRSRSLFTVRPACWDHLKAMRALSMTRSPQGCRLAASSGRTGWSGVGAALEMRLRVWPGRPRVSPWPELSAASLSFLAVRVGTGVGTGLRGRQGKPGPRCCPLPAPPPTPALYPEPRAQRQRVHRGPGSVALQTVCLDRDRTKKRAVGHHHSLEKQPILWASAKAR